MNPKIRGKVFGSLKTGTIDIHIGYGYGMNDGGGLRRFAQQEVPEECQMPNTYVWLTLEEGKVLQIDKMTAVEAEENKWE